MGEYLYRLLEWLDGEKKRKIKVIPYSMAEKIKVFLLQNVIK